MHVYKDTRDAFGEELMILLREAENYEEPESVVITYVLKL